MIHLRVRTEYSFGETFAPVDRVIERLKEIGCTAAGMVDINSTWGHVRWYKACKEAGIQPLLGVELAVGEDERAMWFLAKNEAGLRELYRNSSRAYKQKLATKRGQIPRLYQQDVIDMSDNILKFAGDLLDEPFLVRAGAILDLNPASRILNHAKRSMAERTGLRLVTTADNAYAFPDDAVTFELISNASQKPTPQHLAPISDHQEVAAALAAECAALAMPVAPMIRAEGDLMAMCRDGIKYRKMEDRWNDLYEQRLQHEIKLIREKDFESYFVVVADMVHYAKQHMLVGPSRGSAAGSLACYLARITEIDPMPPKLFFERFIDVSRSDLPDIDLDFPDDKRHMVFEYMTAKYGNVCHIGTISRFQPKSALIQVCKKLNIPPAATGAVKSVMIVRSSADRRANSCLLDTLNDTEPGKQLVSMYPQVMRAADIEAHASHTGIHAAGLLVCNEPIEEFATVDDNGIAHVEKGAAETLGLLKIDVLGLRTLGILEDSGIQADWYNLPFNDPKTYEVFNQGLFCGIFQFEGNAMRAVSKDIHFSSLTDIDAVTALARPGPFGGGVTQEYLLRRNGKPYAALHPLVEEHMAETFGLPVYQEQTLAIVREIGRFDWKETSTIRKAMSKRMGKEFFDTLWPKFAKGAGEQGIPEDKARQTWDLINAMGAWQMNKAHTYSYAVLSYWTAWLKAHHPLEFAAANMRSAKDEETALRLLRESVREGLQYVGFDPRLSEVTWSTKEGKLVAGFDVLKGFGPAKAQKFVDARNAGKLTEEMIQQALNAENPFADIFPMQTAFGGMYDNPSDYGIAGKVWRIAELDGTQTGSTVFLGKLIKKSMRNYNEDVLVKKRNGVMGRGPLDFIDLTLQDDTGMIQARVDRKKFLAMGKEIFETVDLETPLLIRAHFIKDIRFGFIEKWKRL